MLARCYESDDAEDVDRILGVPQKGNVLIDRDQIVLAGSPPIGCLVWRPGCLVHELRTGSGMGRRYIADRLVEFAIKDAISHPFNLYEAIFITNNEDMARYALDDLGAIEEIGKRMFTLKVR